MTPTAAERDGVVCDASALVAALTEQTEVGAWCAWHLRSAPLAAPALAAFEAANILRRHEMAGLVSVEDASAAHEDLASLPVDWWPYAPLAARAWDLRANLTIYDASYVALAEITGHPLVTLDRRLSRAPGLRCEVLTP